MCEVETEHVCTHTEEPGARNAEVLVRCQQKALQGRSCEKILLNSQLMFLAYFCHGFSVYKNACGQLREGSHGPMQKERIV